MTDLQEIFIKNLKYLRKKNKISQRKLAELMGSSPTSISLVECGLRFPTLINIEKIANALHVNSYALFDPNLQDEDKNKLKKELISMKNDMLNKFKEAIDQIIKNYSDTINIQ